MPLVNECPNYLCSAAQTPEMIPMMIQQGYAVIGVAFDVWGLAGLVNDGMKAARAIVEKGDLPEAKEGEPESTEAEVVNGKAPPT